MRVEDKAQEAYNLGIFVGEVKATLEAIDGKLDGFVRKCEMCDGRIRALETAKNGSKKSTMMVGGGTAAAVLALVELVKVLAA